MSRLTLDLDSTLNGDNHIKASSFTSAVLLTTAGTKVTTATIVAGKAIFDLRGIEAGDYFVEVNDDADDLVPTRIDDPSAEIRQRVAQALCASFVGPVDAPKYRINTCSIGQGHGPAVSFSDGTPITGEQPYLIINVALPKVEFRALGTGALLSSTILEVGSQWRPGAFRGALRRLDAQYGRPRSPW